MTQHFTNNVSEMVLAGLLSPALLSLLRDSLCFLVRAPDTPAVMLQYNSWFNEFVVEPVVI